MSLPNLWRKIGLAIDRRYLKKAGATSVPRPEYNLLLICYHPYHGKKSLEIPNQVIITPGDPVCEIHLSNQRITEIAVETNRSLEWHLFEMLNTEFKKMAENCVNGTIPREIQGIYGVNTMGTATKRFGFILIPLPKGWNKLWLGFWESLLRRIFYSYKTKKKASFKRMMDPHEIWISREELIRRYLKHSGS